MRGNSSRRGAVRKDNKKGMQVGSGGHRRKGLQGKGPTPKAEDRQYHPAAKRARRLAKAAGPQRPSRSKARSGKDSTELVIGRNAVLEALRTAVPATHLYVASTIDSDDRVKEALRLASERGLPMLEAGRPELDRLSDGEVHQGLVLQVPPYEYPDLEDLLDRTADVTPLFVALDGITDPRNLGAIIRSAAAFGAHGVIVPERRSAGVTAAAWRTSAGAAARLPVARVTNLNRALQDLRSQGVFVVGLDADGVVDLPGLPLAPDPLVVVVGSEGKGLSRLTRELCDQVVNIPMSGLTESLNAGTAAAVTLYEISRERARLAAEGAEG
ncbi:23S rRNA (guanosine(2251)-2'-O)-methyltransferase RlmB [Kytococcus schroeteri]|uniref:23S rRNA (Guanosine(2251)-2'-O)-methyltransferase RlmB n=1 Tax=Kytococcus schroeteri TaxID=138300 RepID=A0A2I1P996_9MICO|nr:23S rRNA (guanosine(2251)-2'-O)-methyltransferase RlmB [Kytococcus schroeteri]PKZ41197.1 23S rRNA (guanosine(2251)-2'-O)-methyltransferase RlmB [Kytococcus schroeteri]